MCIYNQLIKNRKYTKNQKNGGKAPPVPDMRVKYVPTGCGNCIECRKQKANEWRVRLLEDIKTNPTDKFITLTFSNESIVELMEEVITQIKKDGLDEYGLPKKIEVKTRIGDMKGYERDNAIATRAMRIFNEDWRYQKGKALRHWMITELGHNGTENIHLHGIVWTNESIEEIRRIWRFGWIWPRPHTKIKTYVNGRSINYMMKYVTKVDHKHKEYRQRILASPGIGANYINTRAAQQNIKNGTTVYKTSTGHEMAMPIYWRNKLFTEEDREEMWIKQLNKEVRYVDGNKIDISKGDDVYRKAVEEARRKNAQIGYGGRANENRKEYEEQRRELMIQTRIRKTNASPAGS